MYIWTLTIMDHLTTAPSIAQVVESINAGYSPLTEPCKTEMMALGRLLKIDKGTLLVKEGQYSDKGYFVVKGCFRAYYLKDGKDITDWFAFENDFISSINSFFLGIASPHYIEVLEDSWALEITRDKVQHLRDKYHDFERLTSVIVTKTMLQLQQRVVSLQFETAQQKYDNLTTLNPQIAQRVPLMHIASYLGITLETLSRIRNPKNRI